MSTNKIQYGTSNQPIIINLVSLAAQAAQCSLAIDNTTDLFLDALVVVRVAVPNTSLHGQIRIWAYGTSNGGTDYGDGVTGTDAAATLTYPVNLQLIGTLAVPNPGANAGQQYTTNPLSIAQAFGGHLPAKWGIVVENQIGGSALYTSGSSVWYQGVYEQVA